MEKISQNDAKALLKTAGASIRSLVQENSQLREKLASRDRDDRIRGIVATMTEKDLIDASDAEEKIAELKKRLDLDVIEEGVKLAVKGSGGFNLSNEDDGGQPSASAASALTTFIATGESAD